MIWDLFWGTSKKWNRLKYGCDCLLVHTLSFWDRTKQDEIARSGRECCTLMISELILSSRKWTNNWCWENLDDKLLIFKTVSTLVWNVMHMECQCDRRFIATITAIMPTDRWINPNDKDQRLGRRSCLRGFWKEILAGARAGGGGMTIFCQLRRSD